MKRLFIAFVFLTSASLSAFSQEEGSYRKTFTPVLGIGFSLNVDANGLHVGRYKESKVPDKPAFSASLMATGRLGAATDILNLTFGLGYRGFFDQAPPHDFVQNPSFSDALLYTKKKDESGGSEIRPLGGMLVLPAELHINLIPVSDNGAFFIGGGIEYGVRLYQSKRYEEYFGSHILNKASLSFYPMIGLAGDTDDFGFMLSVFYRRYLVNSFNTKDVPIDKFSRNYLGLQFSVVFGDY